MKRLSLEDVGRQELSGIIGWCLNGSFLRGGGGLGNIFQDVKRSIPFYPDTALLGISRYTIVPQVSKTVCQGCSVQDCLE